jgi:hypothetical protein
MMKGSMVLTLIVIGSFTAACASDGADQSAPELTEPTTYGDDAVILALRSQTDIALDQGLVMQFKHLLRVARTAVPVSVANIHAVAEFTLNSIELKASGEIASGFDRGLHRTGVADLDALLTKYQLIDVDFLFQTSSPDSARWYELVFGQPINTLPLVDAIKKFMISDIAEVSVDGAIGDGDNIYAAHTPDGWLITFDHGYDDCPAGCIHHDRTEVLVAPDDTARIVAPD